MSIYQHFRPEEKEFIDQVLNWRNQVESTYAGKLTDFLDPREQQIVKSLIGENAEIKYAFFGGYSGAERKRAFLYPDYHQIEEEDFQISLFEVEYAKKFVTIEHPQVLGSLMSLGLKRAKFGDILIQNDVVQLIVSKEIESYISLQLESIGRASINLKQIPLSDAKTPEEQWQESALTCSSLRLDAVLAAIFNISRQKAQTFISSKLVKVNWTVIENPSFECREGDMISARGFGRAKMMGIEGKTKKDKWRIVAGKQK
ncbi:RNA-binding protein [Cytobacillus gottheilii]|uniref:RNA-binding protein n=1 Tax=Cytobacillus gottheilii TaxID=859144 RepID=A0ABX8FGS2_9BACI|nr:RNA-binding protein [Cytobacillus gottheilii]QVY63211.1 RNA-binding protein [Cytobacillus gottheilii]